MRDLILAERRWESGRLRHYEFAIEIRCFCVGIAAAPPRFVVTSNTSSVLGSQPAEVGRIYQSFDTVEKLFQRIREVMKRGEHKVAVAYDPDLGYPQVADLDPLERTVDDELYFKVVDFKRVPESAGTPVRVGSTILQLEPTTVVRPALPAAARAQGIVGPVLVEVRISEKGDVTPLSVVRGHPLLNDLATTAVRQWKYEPTFLDGRAIPVIAIAVVSFADSRLPMSR